jgi:hypothetical protein
MNDMDGIGGRILIDRALVKHSEIVEAIHDWRLIRSMFHGLSEDAASAERTA